MTQRKVSTTPDLIISRDPAVMGGQPVFAGTRVPVTHLFEHLAGDYTIAEFVDCFPTVEREQVVLLLERLGDLVADGELTL